jgi:hypothetical protein
MADRAALPVGFFVFVDISSESLESVRVQFPVGQRFFLLDDVVVEFVVEVL